MTDLKKFGLVGRTLKHSFSPMIHKNLYDYPYSLFEIEPENMGSFIESKDFDGLNVTIPYKKEVIPYLDTLSSCAKKIGSVNTIIRTKDNALHGDNTDYYDFLYMLKESGISLEGKKALVLGSGGASLAVKAVLKDQNAGEIITISRTGENNYKNISKHYDADIIVNTTPVGMYPETEKAPIDLKEFKHLEGVFDLIYNPSTTKLLYDAQQLQIPAFNGLSMLVGQAKKSAELFLNEEISDLKINEIVKIIVQGTLNIMLIGMPGSGKSTVGKKLANDLERPFVDADLVFKEKYGVSPAEVIENQGEEIFREMETKVLSEITKESGQIIATGGGVVTRPENRFLCKQNSIVFFLDRDLSLLPTSNRPISQQKGVDTLYRERYPLYTDFCDHKIAVTTVEQTATDIKTIFFE